MQTAALVNRKTLARQLAVLFFAGPQAARNRLAHRASGKQAERILVVRPDHLGDLLFATPSLDMIRQAFPDAHITGLVGPWGKAMWAGNTNLDALETLPFPGIVGQLGGAAPYKLLAESATSIAAGRYSMSLLLRSDHWWGAALVWAAGIPSRYGYRTAGMRPWLNRAVPYIPGRHEVEQDLALALTVWHKESNGRVSFPHVSRTEGVPALTLPVPEPFDGSEATSWLAAGPRQRVIIHPGTAGANKLWTVKGWATVADRLAVQGYVVALTGSPAEAELCGWIWEAAQSKPTSLAGKTASVPQLLWLLQQAGFVLGVDSGPLHMADALGKPTLHLYGPSDERVWGPWGDPLLHRTLRAPGTRPTMNLGVDLRQLEGGPEMQAIAVEMVIREVDMLTTAAGRQ